MKDNEKPTLKEFYNLEQLSEELGISKTGLKGYVKNGELKVSKVANKYIVQRENIKQWLNANELTNKELAKIKKKFKASYEKAQNN